MFIFVDKNRIIIELFDGDEIIGQKKYSSSTWSPCAIKFKLKFFFFRVVNFFHIYIYLKGGGLRGPTT